MLSRRSWRTIAGHLALRVEHQLGLRQVEVERPALEAAPAHQLRQLVHRQQRLDQRRVALPQPRVAVDDRLRLLVRELRRAADDAVVELRAAHAALAVQLDHDRLGEPVLALDQAADAARQRVRQHRHDVVREVDRGAAEVGLLVERAALAHVVRHVGDVHGQAPAAARQALDADRVVVVARRLGVDRERGPAAEVRARRPRPRPRPGGRRAAPPARPPRERRCGSAYLARTTLRSTPGSLTRPSTSSTRPIGLRVAVGGRVISASTISPGSAPCSSPAGMNTSCSTRLSKGTRWPPKRPSLSKRPTMRRFARSSTRMIRPSGPRVPWRSMRATTRSPWSASRMFAAATNTSGSRSRRFSGTTKP